MTFPAAPPSARSLIVVVILVLAGCSTEAGPDEDGPRLASEAVRSPQPADADDGAEPDPETDPDEDVAPAPGSSDPDPELSPDPDIVYPADTCYDRAAAGAAATEVGCDEPHDIEVYASIELPGGPGAAYLGMGSAFEACGAEFDRITGVGINLATVFDRSLLRPSEETWVEGERDVTCYVVFPEPVAGQLRTIDPVRSFGRVSVFGLEVGDCLAEYEQSAAWFELTPCDAPHEAEVGVAERLPDGGFPGDLVIDELSSELCFGAPFEDYVGLDYPSSEIYAVPSLPTVETWLQGDRTINCVLTDDQVNTGSFQGSAR